MKRSFLIIAILVVTATLIGLGIDWQRRDSPTRKLWQQVVTPGPLSQSHAFLSNSCSTCHTPVKGVEAARCVTCHANNTELLQRQPTAFHANIQVCSGCHVEHKGSARMPTTMDHALLAKVSHRELEAMRSQPKVHESGMSAKDVGVVTDLLKPNPSSTASAPMPAKPKGNAENCDGAAGCTQGGKDGRADTGVPIPLSHLRREGEESMLNCASCHATKDRHQGLFGSTCSQCHATTQWTVSAFRHPSPRSTECAQCHKPPPSHNMMHFEMMSVPLARQPNAKVNQCYLCHQSTSWNDIKGAGWIKHH